MTADNNVVETRLKEIRNQYDQHMSDFLLMVERSRDEDCFERNVISLLNIMIEEKGILKELEMLARLLQ